MQTFEIWTRVDNFISYENEYYAPNAAHNFLIFVSTHIKLSATIEFNNNRN